MCDWDWGWKKFLSERRFVIFRLSSASIFAYVLQFRCFSFGSSTEVSVTLVEPPLFSGDDDSSFSDELILKLCLSSGARRTLWMSEDLIILSCLLLTTRLPTLIAKPAPTDPLLSCQNCTLPPTLTVRVKLLFALSAASSCRRRASTKLSSAELFFSGLQIVENIWALLYRISNAKALLGLQDVFLCNVVVETGVINDVRGSVWVILFFWLRIMRLALSTIALLSRLLADIKLNSIFEDVQSVRNFSSLYSRSSKLTSDIPWR